MEQDSQPDALRTRLRAWGRRSRKLSAERDPLVRAGLAAGITREEIHGLMGIARTTVDNIARKPQNSA